MINFNESSWTIIEPLLPSQIIIRQVVLDDFIWFMSKTKKYKDDKQKIEDYIHHLSLKKGLLSDTIIKDGSCFKLIDISRIESELFSIFVR